METEWLKPVGEQVQAPCHGTRTSKFTSQLGLMICSPRSSTQQALAFDSQHNRPKKARCRRQNCYLAIPCDAEHVRLDKFVQPTLRWFVDFCGIAFQPRSRQDPLRKKLKPRNTSPSESWTNFRGRHAFFMRAMHPAIPGVENHWWHNHQSTAGAKLIGTRSASPPSEII